MAKIYEDRQSTALNVALYPQAGVPLDIRNVFYSMNDFEAYVRQDKTYAPEAYDAADKAFLQDIISYSYAGQVAVVVVDNVAKAYVINEIGENGSYSEVGAAPVGDNKSVTVVDSVIQLNNFGTQYYKYNTAYVEGGEAAKYILTEGWTENLTPKVVKVGDNYELAWYEPDPSTVEGLKDQVNSLAQIVGDDETKGTLVYDLAQLDAQMNTGDDAIAARVVSLETTVGDADGGLVAAVEGLRVELVGEEGVSEGLINASERHNVAITTLDQQVNGVEEDGSDGIASRLAAVESDLNTATTGIKDVLEDVAGRVGSLEDAVGSESVGLIADVADHETRIGNLETAVNGDSGLAAQLADVKKELGVIEGKDGVIQAVAGLDTQLNGEGGVDSRLTTVEGLVSGLTSTGLSREILGSREEFENLENPKDNVIYMVPRTSDWDKEADGYDEYLYVNGSFELIGNTDVSFANYYTKDEVDAMPHLSQTDVESIISTETNAEDGTIAQAISGAVSALSQEVATNHYTKDEVDGLLGTADQAAKGYATTAENNATAYVDKALDYYDTSSEVDGKISTHLTSAPHLSNSDVQGIISDELGAEGSIATAISGAVSAVDAQAQGYASAAEQNAKDHADGAASAAQNAACTYAEGQAQTAYNNAVQYADDTFLTEDEVKAAAQGEITSALVENGDIAMAIAIAETAANKYTNEALAALGQGNLNTINAQLETWAGEKEADKEKSIREIAVEVAQQQDVITSVAPEFTITNKQLSINEECVFILNGGNASGYVIVTDEQELV